MVCESTLRQFVCEAGDAGFCSPLLPLHLLILSVSALSVTSLTTSSHHFSVTSHLGGTYCNSSNNFPHTSPWWGTLHCSHLWKEKMCFHHHHTMAVHLVAHLSYTVKRNLPDKADSALLLSLIFLQRTFLTHAHRAPCVSDSRLT